MRYINPALAAAVADRMQLPFELALALLYRHNHRIGPGRKQARDYLNGRRVEPRFVDDVALARRKRRADRWLARADRLGIKTAGPSHIYAKAVGAQMGELVYQ